MKTSKVAFTGLIFCLALFILFGANSAYGQSKTRKSSSTQCLSVNEAEELIQNLEEFSVGSPYLGGFSYNFRDLDIPAVKRADPILSAFQQKGYVSYETQGYTFSIPTRKGERLLAQYPDGIPLSIVALNSVNKITCANKKANIDITMSFKPTKLALNLLGNTVYTVKPFNGVKKYRIAARHANGRWIIDSLTNYSLLNQFNR